MNAANGDFQNEIELLLPWHAAGTLSQRDAQRVEAALASDRELARRYQLVREELGETIHLNETLGAPSARAMEALFARIDAEPVRRARLSAILAARIGAFFADISPRTLAWSASAAAVAIVLQAGVIAGIVYKENAPIAASYRTASASVGDGSYALVRFQPQAKAAEIGKFLESNELSLAGGPSAGMFRLKLADKKLAKADVDGLVKKLRQDKVVGFIAPSE
jgi:anti-sigma factor RsiW